MSATISSMMNTLFPCPCCNSLTLSAQSPGTFEICSICEWEDDPVQFEDPTLEGGANTESLEQARKRFREQ